MAEARYEIVAFIDDDAMASRSGLDAIGRAFLDPAISTVTGLVLPAEMETRAQYLFQEYGGMGKGLAHRLFVWPRPVAQVVAAQNFGVGNNMAFRREVFRRVGPFDTALDVGTPSCGCGDLDMLHRVAAFALALRYEPAAWIRHRDRRDMDSRARQIYQNGRSFGVYLIKVGLRGSVPRLEWAGFLKGWIFNWLLGRMARRVMGRSPFPLRLLLAEIRGAMSAPWAYIATYRYGRRLRRASPPDNAR